MRIWTWALVGSSLLLSGLASAQTGDKASAEILFNEGRALMQQGNYQLACEKLAESQRMDPAVGTLLNLGDCQEKLGRTASAWATWLEAAAAARSAGQPEREAHARQRAQALQPKLVTLTIDVPPEHRIPGLAVVRNTVSIGPALWGTAAPVDPGKHEISATAAGYQKWSTVVSVSEGTPARVLVPQLVPEAAAAPAPTSAPPPAPVPAPVPGEAPPPAPVEQRSSPPILAYVAGGVGVAGIAVGSIFGLRAMKKNDDSKEACDSDNECDKAGKKLRDDAFTAATISTVGFAVGGVGLASAVVLLLVAPKQESAARRPGILTVHAGLEPRGGAIAIDGVF
jgi:hypothetical protein